LVQLKSMAASVALVIVGWHGLSVFESRRAIGDGDAEGIDQPTLGDRSGRDDHHARANHSVVKCVACAVLDCDTTGGVFTAGLLCDRLVYVGVKRLSNPWNLLAMVLAQHVDELLLN